MADVTIAVEAQSLSKTRTDVSVRDLVFSVDEPERLGGTNTGPNPVEYLLGSLAGCLSYIGHLVAREMGFEIQSMRMHIEGNLDPLAYLGAGLLLVAVTFGACCIPARKILKADPMTILRCE